MEHPNADYPLKTAIQHNDMKAVISLIQNGDDVNYIDTGNDDMSLLMLAAFRGNTEICKCLIHNGSDLNATDRYGENALHYAARKGHFDCVKALLDAGVSGKVKASSGSPLSAAIYSGCAKTVQALIHCKVPSESAQLLSKAMLKNSLDILKILLENGYDPNVRDDMWETALHKAAQYHSLEMMQLLVEAGAKVNVQAYSGVTPLIVAVRRGSVEAVKFLLSQGADPNIKDKSFSQLYAIHYAAQLGHTECLQELLLGGAELDPRDRDGMTPLLRSIGCGSQENHTYMVLIQEGCDLNIVATLPSFNIRLHIPRSPLELALKTKRFSLAKLICVLLGPSKSSTMSQAVIDISTSVTDEEGLKAFQKWFLWHKFSCASLKHMCRLSIRNSLQPGPISKKLDKLKLPIRIVDYLFLRDLVPVEATQGREELVEKNMVASDLAYFMPALWINHDSSIYAN